MENKIMSNMSNTIKNGKGSKRRPCLIKDNDFSDRWNQIKWNSKNKQNKFINNIRVK